MWIRVSKINQKDKKGLPFIYRCFPLLWSVSEGLLGCFAKDEVRRLESGGKKER